MTTSGAARLAAFAANVLAALGASCDSTPRAAAAAPPPSAEAPAVPARPRSKNDLLAGRFRDLYAAGSEDSARALVRANIARAPDVLSAIHRAAYAAAGPPPIARGEDPAAWWEAAAIFARLARLEHAEPVVDTVATNAIRWKPADWATKALAESLYTSGYAALVAHRPDDARGALAAADSLFRSIDDRYRAGYVAINLALAARELGDATAARAFLDEARGHFGRTRDRRGEGWALSHLGALETDSGAYARAESLFAAALEMARATRDLEREAEVGNNLGNVYLARGRFREAGALYSAAATGWRALSNAALETAALQNLGIVQEMLGEIGDARRTLESCLASASRLGDESLVAHVESNLANVLFSLGETARAESLHVAALARDAASGNAAAQAADMENLARLLAARGLFTAAQDTITSALGFCDAANLPRQRVYLLLARARLLRDVNELARAAGTLESAANEARAIGDRSAEGQALGALGEIALLSGEPDRAERALAEALEAHVETGEAARLIEVTNLRAHALLLSGRFAHARAVADSAAERAARLGLAIEGARSLWLAGEVAAAENRLTAAEDLFARAAHRLPAGFEHNLGWQIDLSRARVAERRGDLDSALARLLDGIARVETVRQAVLDQRWRARYVEDKESLFAEAVSLLLALGRNEEAFAMAEQARGRVLIDLLTQQGGSFPAAAAAHLSAEARAAARRIETLSARWRDLEEGGVEDSEQEAAGAIARGLRDAAEQYERAALRSVRLAPAGTARAVSWDAVRRGLRGGDALVAYFFARDGLVAFVASPAGLETIALDVSYANIDDRIRVARALLEDPASSLAEIDDVLDGISEQILGPLLPCAALRDARRLFIVPHRALHHLPFAALPARESASSPTAVAPAGAVVVAPGTGSESVSRLVSRFDVAIVPSASVLTAEHSARSASARGAGAFLVLGCADSPGRARLPHAEEEARRVAGSARGGLQTELLVGDRASEALLKERAPAAARLHIATHGSTGRGSPLLSALTLRPGPSDDGLLEVHEILRLSLQCDLAILSGCGTGQAAGYGGGLSPGDEVLSIGHAFLAAGAKTVVATLWPVSDRATADFMVDLHLGLVGLDPIGALARTQRRWVKGEVARAHPYYWAGAVALVSASGDSP